MWTQPNIFCAANADISRLTFSLNVVFSLYMQTLCIILVWFCVGWTIATFPILMGIVGLSLWANIENKKHQEKIRQLLSEDKDSE